MTDGSNSRGLPPFVKGELSLDTWNDERRKEILNIFRHEVFGVIPSEDSLSVSFRVAAIKTSGAVMEGRAIRKTVEIAVKRGDLEFAFPLLVFIPVQAEKNPVSAILTICGSAHEADPTRSRLNPMWPAETLVSRGFAAAVVLSQDIAPDYDENFTLQFHRLFPEYVSRRPDDMMGTITAWAWGMAKAVDYLYGDPLIRKDEIAVVGLSRRGKTALWCGVQNPRVALTVSCCSGCTGAALSRGKAGETIKNITTAFPYWFCKNYQKYGDNEDALPVDQHMLLGLIAPRLLYVSSKSRDIWCDPKSEFGSLKEASAVYKLYGKLGSPLGEMPPPEHPVFSGNIGYHVKTGEHSLDEYDWDQYLNFCEDHFHPAR
jgi:hypothetical protein